MAERYYLGIDQGTTGTTVLLADKTFRCMARGYCEHTQYYPQPGWVEHDPEEIWQALLSAVKQALDTAGADPSQLACIGLDNQGETCLIWDRQTGAPVAPAIVWQDRRTAQYADQLSRTHKQLILQRTGLPVDAYFSGTKLRWLLNNIPGLRERAAQGEVLAGTLDSWLLWKLTGGRIHATDSSTASRTMLYRLSTDSWDPELLQLLDIPAHIMPEIRDSVGLFGMTDPDAFFGISVPITAAITDQQAALFDQGCLTPGKAKATYGTGCFLQMNTGSQPIITDRGLMTTVAWGINDRQTYALEGSIYIAGAAIQWLRDGLKLITSAKDTYALATSVADNGGVYFVPAFAGLAAPHWDQYARGTIVGLTGGVTDAHLVRATLESVAYQVYDNLYLMQEVSGMQIPVLRTDGGMAANPFLMQFQADLLGIPVEVPEVVDATAMGAARCAALGLGEFATPEECCSLTGRVTRYEPAMHDDQRQSLLHQWHRAVERALAWAEP